MADNYQTGTLPPLNSVHAWIFFAFLSSADFSEINFFQILFQEYHQSVKYFDPDQARRSVLPDLGTHSLHRLSADGTGRLRVKPVHTSSTILHILQKKHLLVVF